MKRKNAIRTRINDLYEKCGNVSPIIYFIEALTKEFNGILGNNSNAFESKLRDAEETLDVYYNKNGVSRLTAESDLFNHFILYSVQDKNESEAHYFYHLELANLFITNTFKGKPFINYLLKKVYNGYSEAVTSPIFYH